MTTTTLEVMLTDEVIADLEYISKQENRSTHDVAIDILRDALKDKIRHLKDGGKI